MADDATSICPSISFTANPPRYPQVYFVVAFPLFVRTTLIISRSGVGRVIARHPALRRMLTY